MNTTVQSIIDTLTNLKTGWKTSEFWVAAAPIFVALLNVFGVHLSNSTTTHTIVIVWGAVSAVYVAARTFVKSVHIGHVSSLSAILSDVENAIPVGQDVTAIENAVRKVFGEEITKAQQQPKQPEPAGAPVAPTV